MDTDTQHLLQDVDNLWFGCEDTGSREYDWSRGYGEEWTSFEPIEDAECDCGWKGCAVGRSGSWECPECQTDHDCDSAEGPMMNYFYALPDHGTFGPDDAAKLDGLPLCLINFSKWGEDTDDSLPDWALALTGGGMNLGWEIAEAHMRLGFLPPLFVAADLPRLAGKDYSSPKNRWIIEGCQRTAKAVSASAQRAYDRLAEMTGVE